jgi:hypothetical protein
MRGIPEINAIIGRNALTGDVAFCRLDTKTHVLTSVRVDCSIDANATTNATALAASNGGPAAPDYSARAYRMPQPASLAAPVVCYPHCAGWDEGFGASYVSSPGFLPCAVRC